MLRPCAASPRAEKARRAGLWGQGARRAAGIG
jgi:hypothetical protein